MRMRGGNDRREEGGLLGEGLEKVVHGGGGPRGEPARVANVFDARLLNRLEGTEVPEEGLSAFLSYAGNLLKDREETVLAPKLLVVGDGEAVRLVSDLLEEVPDAGPLGECHRRRPMRLVNELILLGQCDDRKIPVPRAARHPERHVE